MEWGGERQQNRTIEIEMHKAGGKLHASNDITCNHWGIHIHTCLTQRCTVNNIHSHTDMRGVIVGGAKAWGVIRLPLSEIRTMKVRSSVKKLCKDCKIGLSAHVVMREICNNTCQMD